MQTENEIKTSRRSFFTAAARNLALAGLAVFAAGSVLKRKQHLREGKCVDLQGRTGCQACRVFSECGLPRAMSVRQFLTRSK